MLDALSFALFGRSHRNINKPQLINSINNKAMLVEVEFLVNKTQYKVVRGLKPTKFEIWKEGILLNQNSHSKEYQKILEQNILKLNHKSFHQIVVLGSSSFIPFMQLPSHHRREVIEDLLDIGVFSKMNQILKERTSLLKDKVQSNKHECEIVKTKISGAKANIVNLKGINKHEKSKKETAIKELREEIDFLTKEIDNILIEINKYAPIREQDSKYNARLSKIDKLWQKMSHEIGSLNKQIDFFSNNNICPSCDQEISDEKKNEKTVSYTERKERLGNAIAELKLEKEKCVEELVKIQGANSEVMSLNEKLGIKNSTIMRIEDQISAIENELSNPEKNINIVEAEKQLEDLRLELDNKYDERSQLIEQAEYNMVIGEMLKDSGFKAKIIKQYLPVINKLVNHYLQTLDFFVHFDLNEEFRETIRSRFRDTFSYDSFSEGEKQRIDLSLLFTWRQVAKMKNSVSTNLLVLDETFDSSLDADGVDNLMKILDTLDDNTNVFVISHKGDVLEGKFQSKIEFKKDKNFSKKV